MPSGQNGRPAYSASSTLQHRNPEHCTHHHLTVLQVSSEYGVVGVSCLPAQLKQRALVALAAAASSDSKAQSLSDTLCTSRLHFPSAVPSPPLSTRERSQCR
jgi:hypothetical protein